MRIYVMLVIFIILFSSAPHAATETVRINKVEAPKEQLILSLLELALQKAAPDLEISQLGEVIPTSRWANQTQDGSLDLIWAGASKDLDERLLAVRIPLLKGLLGHRIFIIRKDEKATFKNISNLSELKRYKAGMGAFWGSTKVLEKADLKVVKTIKYQNLFHMLDGDRFDYFPRAAHEPWAELAERPDLDLAVEENLLLIYPYAMYFYTQKGNTELHKTIQQGLEMALADGSYDALFFSNELIKNALTRAKLSERLVLRIDNPDMHPDTPVDRPELWLDVSSL